MKELLSNLANAVLSKQQMKQIKGGYGGGESHKARCFKGNDLKCTVYRPTQECTTQQDSDDWCRSGCELDWDCSDCNG